MVKKLVLVTGASRGIGLEIFKAFAQQDIEVVGTATSQAGVDFINNLCKENNWSASGCILNLTIDDTIQSTLEYCQATYQTMPNILVNNAGVTDDTLALRMQKHQWENVIATNLTGVFSLTQSVLKSMMKARWGRIINISSIVGLTGNFGQTNYAAAKAGVIGFSKSLALETASRNITVNVVAPGFIDTDMTQGLSDTQKSELTKNIPMQRTGLPHEIAAVVLFLASEGASYITGSTLHVNGGMFMN
jgi:3-oxoacyl-[acyl-carrier protein] reductase